MKQKLNGSPPKVDNGKVSEALSKSIDGSFRSSMKIENRDPRMKRTKTISRKITQSIYRAVRNKS